VKKKTAPRGVRPRASKPLIGTLAIFGVGLIGGSFALALKRAGAVGRVLGVGRSKKNLETARKRRIIDEIATPAEAAARADVVLLATPLGQMAPLLAAIAPHLGPRTIVTDAGSTKQEIIAAARRYLGAALPRFVPAHPIAGTEKHGAIAAFPELYKGRKLVVTPLPQTSAAAVRIVTRSWQACGMQVVRMRPAEHDRVFATVSHLPHLLAFAMVDIVATDPEARQLFGFAAGGFRDFTRIAGSTAEMWRDICATNRAAVLAVLERYEAKVEEMHALLERGDFDGLAAVMDRASRARNRWAHRQGK
jgi:prephenate dehydrogenase